MDSKREYHKKVKSRLGFPLLIGFLLVSCASPVILSGPTAASTQPTQPTETMDPASTSVLPTRTTSVVTQPGTPESNCATEEVTKFGESIASSYSFTSTQEVMAWFCEGAEFEDILVALETEEITGTAAEDLLQMRADGLSWDEIWQSIGLYGK
jgi:hypothetical protein